MFTRELYKDTVLCDLLSIIFDLFTYFIYLYTHSHIKISEAKGAYKWKMLRISEIEHINNKILQIAIPKR